jgi:hypothetical protein
MAVGAFTPGITYTSNDAKLDISELLAVRRRGVVARRV